MALSEYTTKDLVKEVDRRHQVMEGSNMQKNAQDSDWLYRRMEEAKREVENWKPWQRSAMGLPSHGELSPPKIPHDDNSTKNINEQGEGQ